MPRMRAKLTPMPTPRGLPPTNKKPIYGDVMTPKAFRLWADEENEDETKRLGAPAFKRELVEVLDDGTE